MAITPGVGVDLKGAIPFSAKSEWNIRVDYAPLAAGSASIISQINPTKGLKADFGAGTWEGSKIGIPYVVVPHDQDLVEFVENLWPEEGDDGPFPIPDNPPIEQPNDHHMIIVQLDPNAPNGLGKLYEIYEADFIDGKWNGQAAVFDMQGGDHQRPDGFTSADAAGLPVFPGLARYDEVAHAVDDNTTLGHALRFTLSQANTAMGYIGAASHTADSIDGAAPFGMHVRLRSDFVIPADATAEVWVIINTLKQYGMILADNGSDWFVSGSPDERWDNEALQVLSQVKGQDFEVVDNARLAELIGSSRRDNMVGSGLDNIISALGGDDRINGMSGKDKINAGAGADRLFGDTGADRLFGEGGRDLLYGGAGTDRLSGGGGADSFVFNASLLASNADMVTDFSGKDLFLLDNAVFTKLGEGTMSSHGRLAADAFHIGKVAADAQDRIIYDKGSGSLYYDSDGAGGAAAVKFAAVDNGTELNNGDFHII